jgi:hypothetical protein
VCEKCSEIDLHIARYEGLKGQTTDRVFLAGVAEILRLPGRESRSAPPGEVRPPRSAASLFSRAVLTCRPPVAWFETAVA